MTDEILFLLIDYQATLRVEREREQERHFEELRGNTPARDAGGQAEEGRAVPAALVHCQLIGGAVRGVSAPRNPRETP
jgi:hypothetical protein